MRPNNERSKRLIIILWVFTGVMVLTGISDFLQYQLLSRAASGSVTIEEANANDIRQLIVAVIGLAFYIITAVFFIQWFRRAYYNLHLLSKDLSFSEGWASGAWFVPFLNLGRPFVIMKEMMFVAESKLIGAKLVSENNARRTSVGIWWTLWIIVSVLSSTNSRIQAKSTDLNTLINTSLFDIIIGVLYIPLTFFTVKMIRHYVELEEKLPQLDGVEKAKVDNPDLLDTL